MKATSEAVGRRPHPWLAPYINRYIGYRQHGFASGIHRGLPSRYLTVILDLIGASGSVSGLHAGAALLHSDGHAHGIAVEVLPLGVRDLFGVAAGELAGATVDLDTLMQTRHWGLAERVRERSEWGDRFDVLDEVLRRQLQRRPTDPRLPRLTRAWEMLVEDAAVPIAAAAEDVGWSRQHLTACFRAETGLSPRQLRRVLRLERTCQLLRSPARIPGAQVAIMAGYYDQAHLLHEWGALVGGHPDEWLGEELPSLLGETVPPLEVAEP